MVAEVATTPPRKPRRPRINLALASTLLAAGQTFEEIAPIVGAKSANSLQVSLCKKKLCKRKIINIVAEGQSPDLTRTLTQRVVIQATDALKEISERTRATLANAVLNQAEVVAKAKVPRGRDDQNQTADTTLKLVKAASGIHGWEDQHRSALVVGGVLTSLSSEEAPAIDVESSTPEK